MKRLLTVLSLLFMTSSWVMGLSLEPLTQEFSTSGRNSTRTFRVTNTQSQPLAVRLFMTTRTISSEGEEVREDASDLFLVFPERVLLQPGQSQAVRVQWRGGELEDRERAFRIIAEQLPVNEGDDAEGLNINFVYRYEGSVYVVPENASEPAINLAGMTPLPGVFDGRREVMLRFENSGGRHAVIRNVQLLLSRRDGVGNRDTIVLGEAELPRINGRNMLAGSVVQQSIYVPATWEISEIETTLDYEIAE